VWLSSGEGAVMRTLRILAVVCLLMTVPACTSNNKGKIVGKWRSLDGQIPHGGTMTLEFTADGKVTIEASGVVSKRITGKYSLGMSDFVTFSDLSEPVAGRRTHGETVRINGSTLTMRDFDGTTLNFSRF
jgi:hypothetical protein